MVKCGKVLHIKKTKNNIFLIIKDESESVVQFIIKKDDYNTNLYDVNIGDVIKCNLEVDVNNNSKYSVPFPSYIVNSLEMISKHIEDLQINPNIEAIVKYSLVKYNTRLFLNKQGYIEIDVPTLMDDEVSSKAKSFNTEHYYSKTKLFLRKTMDPYLRILSCCGMNKIYSIGDVYRNEHVTSFRQPSFEMLSIFSNYSTRDDMIEFCINLLSELGCIKDKKIELISYDDYKVREKSIDDDSIYIISNYPILVESNAKKDFENNYSSEFKVKYKSRTIIHGVEEICDINEYNDMLLNQGKTKSIGDLEILRNCLASGAVPCYNVGISLQRIVALFNDMTLKDINPFPFSRIKIRRLKNE